MIMTQLQSLKAFLESKIKGQTQAIEAIIPILWRGELGLSDPIRPKGSFLFVGPTGTGKTELTKLFTEHLLGQERFLRIDMSEFSHANAVQRLLGDATHPLGFLGEQMETFPSGGTLLFDEIEKAHTTVLDLLLQILDAGRLTSFNKKVLNFSNYYIVCTSNIGSGLLSDIPHAAQTTKERIITEALEQELRPEFLGRFSKKILFNSLSFDTQKEICISMVTQELNRLKSLGYADIKCDENAITALFLGGYSTKYGARQLRDFIQEQISNAIINTLKDNKQPTGVLTFSKKQHSLVFLQTTNDSEPEVKDPTLFLKWFFHLSNSREH